MIWSKNPLHPNISMHILQTFLYTFPKVLTIRRICLTSKNSFSWWSYATFLWPECVIQGWYCKEKLDAIPSQGSKGEGFVRRQFLFVRVYFSIKTVVSALLSCTALLLIVLLGIKFSLTIWSSNLSFDK